jgi:hypothetical protein
MAEEQKRSVAPMMLLTELLFEHRPELDYDAIEFQMFRRLPNTQRLGTEKKEMLLFAHEDHVTELADGAKMPAHLTVVPYDEPMEADRIRMSLHQSRNWPDVQGVAERFRWQVLVSEFAGFPLPYRDRVRLFYEGLIAVVEATRPLGVFVQHADKLLNPAEVLKASGSEDPLAPFMLGLNVRLFRLGDTGDLLMDTRGMAALGLADFQMHFRGLNPGRIASLLFNYARYIYEHGDCITDGETIEGATPDQRWRCQHEMAIYEPERVVVDVDPGPPFAAGNRH